MAEAGVLPAEITRIKEATVLRSHLATQTDGAVRKVAMADLARVDVLQAVAADSRRKLPTGQRRRARLAARTIWPRAISPAPLRLAAGRA